MVTNPTVISKNSKNKFAKPYFLPKFFPVQVKTPPFSQPSTVAISAAHKATGINHKKPPKSR